MQDSEGQRIREHEQENSRLKKLVGEAGLDKAALKAFAECCPRYVNPTLRDIRRPQGM